MQLRVVQQQRMREAPGRILKEKSTKPAAPEPTQAKVTAKAPNDAWLIDLTAVPIGGVGFWVPWIPFSLPQCWPFCYWVGAVMDMYSRRIQGVAVFCREPTSKQIRSFLNRVVAHHRTHSSRRQSTRMSTIVSPTSGTSTCKSRVATGR